MVSLSSDSPTVKFCHDCGETKPLIEFRTRNDIHSGINSYCKLCERVRRSALRLALETKPITDRDIQKFWANVKKADGCWEWQGSTTPDGYGKFYFRYNSLVAHRFSYTLTNGSIPDGLYVCHHCDNPPCVRPDHLFLGTQKDNIHDMLRKHRGFQWTKPDLFYSRRFATVDTKGELNGRAKLTLIEVRAIRARFAAGGLTKAALAREYQISESAIFDIVTGRRWKD